MDVEGGVYPGMQVTVTIPREEAVDVVILKEDALSFDRTNQAFVYQADAQGNLQQVYVKTGVSNGNYVEIAEGLKSGDSVFVEVKTETASTVTSLLSGLFGRQTFMGGGGSNFSNRTNQGGGSFNFGNGSGGSGNWPSMPGGSGGSGSGGFGGGRQ